MSPKKFLSFLLVAALPSSLFTLQAYSAEQAIQPVHAIAMHGKPLYDADFKHFKYTSPLAVKGGKLKLGVQGNFDSLNPFIIKGSAADRIGLIYDTLTSHSGDEAFTEYGLIAESIEMPEDRSWVIYNLRPQARFNDGHAITAEDVVFTFNLLIEKGNPFYRSYYGQVKDVIALSPTRVKFIFDDSVNRELALIVGQLPIFPKHFWEGKDFNQSSLEPPLGSGPYTIAKVDAGKSIVYQRATDYWARDLPVNVGLYNYDQIQLDYYKDSTVLLEALKAGEYDLRIENSSKQWATGYTGTAIDKGLLKTELIEHQNPTGMQSFIMNLRNPLFQDIRVRQALNYAFDFEWTNKNLFYGAYTRTSSFFSNSELASSGMPSGRELEILLPFKDQLPATVFEKPFTLPVSNADGYNRKNLRIAKKLLNESGWRVVNNQLVNEKTGEPFTFEIILMQPSFERIVNPYVKALKKLGIIVNVRHIEISQYINRMRNFEYDMVVSSFGQSLSPGNEQVDFWGSNNADVKGSRNLIGIKNPVIDKLIDLILTAPDREELIYRTRALDRVLLNYYYVIPQWHSRSHRIAYWDKFSRPAFSPKYDPNFSLGYMTWWIDKDKESRLDKSRQSLQ